MKNFKYLPICFLLILIHFGCNNSNNQDSSKSGSTKTEIYIAPEPSKEIEWKDGNTYSYDYTETISRTDSLGNEQIITVYKRNRPEGDSGSCDSKICKWCSNTSYASNYSIEEYPNINWLRGEPDLNSFFGILGSLIDGNSYYDLDNNKVRTEWKANYEYIGPNGFCSEKCNSEYNNR